MKYRFVVVNYRFCVLGLQITFVWVWHLWVTIPWLLASQIEGVLCGFSDVISWVARVLGAFAGLSSKTQQEVFACLDGLAKANCDIMLPSELLRLRLLMLHLQAVVGCLPRT